jgi:hypothetical protein
MKIFDWVFRKKHHPSLPPQDDIEMHVRRILRGRSEDVIKRVLGTLREKALAKPIPDPTSSEFEDSVRFIHDYEVDLQAKREGREEDRLFSDWGSILVTKPPHQDKHASEKKDDTSTDLVSKEESYQGKRCAFCGVAVDQTYLQCPKCGRGVFDSPKTPKELRTGGSLPKGLRSETIEHEGLSVPKHRGGHVGIARLGDDLICPACHKRMCTGSEISRHAGSGDATFTIHCPHCGEATEVLIR